ncbi:unnamed protein product [Clonostachys rosea f. rosea IK726]|uniref:Uncharacterized protein n=1 Tax=Clonostachys rosea f. rosea IK726 TaxID=1349383 RepID=A0ACA9U8W0_BIOOC|nr:unnamed protein product [Clonostachys rosea f. rosea IK726]
MAMCVFAVAAVVTETPTLADRSKEKSVGIATVFLMFLFALFYKPPWGATVWIWTSEELKPSQWPRNLNQFPALSSAWEQDFEYRTDADVEQIFPIFLNEKGLQVNFQ